MAPRGAIPPPLLLASAWCTSAALSAESDLQPLPHAAEPPGPDWPAPTAAESNGSWPSGHQPWRLEAWPQTGSGANRTLLPCWKKTILRDRGEGWPGLCLGLFRAEKVSELATCQDLCLAEPRCSVWQFVNQTSPGQCWAGYGTDCIERDGRPSAITVEGAQRVMHGDVMVLKNMSGRKIHGLHQLGELRTSGSETSVDRCRAWCYSDVGCQYWQYGPGGCWVDSLLFSADSVVQYPLTTSEGATSEGYEAENMRWGEYIQHYCPPQPTQDVESSPSWHLSNGGTGDATLLPEQAAGATHALGSSALPAGGSLAIQLPKNNWSLAMAVAAGSLCSCVCCLLWARRGQRSKTKSSHSFQDAISPDVSQLDDFEGDGPELVPIGSEPWLDKNRAAQSQWFPMQQPLQPGFEDLESRLKVMDGVVDGDDSVDFGRHMGGELQGLRQVRSGLLGQGFAASTATPSDPRAGGAAPGVGLTPPQLLSARLMQPPLMQPGFGTSPPQNHLHHLPQHQNHGVGTGLMHPSYASLAQSFQPSAPMPATQSFQPPGGPSFVQPAPYAPNHGYAMNSQAMHGGAPQPYLRH